MGNGSRYFEGVVRDNRTAFKYGKYGNFASAAAPQQASEGRSPGSRCGDRGAIRNGAIRRRVIRATYWYLGSSGRAIFHTFSVVVYSL